MISIAWTLGALGFGLGTFMGLAMLVRPRASHLSIGLASVPEKSGGVGESRAFGGLLLALHAAPLALIVVVLVSMDASRNVQQLALVMSGLMGLGWLSAFLGRALSVIVDREGLPLNARLLALDAVMTLSVSAPVMLRILTA